MSELQKIDTVVGEGKEAITGNHVDVHYTGWLFDDKAADHKGQKFDSSLDRGQLFSFPLGAGNVIKGWDEGVAGMKVAVNALSSSPLKWAMVPVVLVASFHQMPPSYLMLNSMA